MNQQSIEFELKKMHVETLRLIISARYNIIFTTSSLGAAALVVATFNSDVLCLSLRTTKVIVVLLLSIIPISLIDYTCKLARDEKHVLKALNIEEVARERWNKKNFLEKIWINSSYIYVTLIALVLGFIVYSIFNSL